MDAGDSRAGKAGLLSLPFGPATWAQTARFPQGLQAFQELGRVDQPRLTLDDSTRPAGLSLLFRNVDPGHSEAMTLPILLFHCFLFKPKVVPIPSHPHCSFYLG